LQTHKNLDAIIAYAKQRGLKNAEIKYNAFNQNGTYTLHGTGRDENGWPLVMRICYETHIDNGCGSNNWQYINPDTFELPTGETQE
jgi:hypothetical protein